MPPRSKVKQLPPEMKAWLDQYLVDTNFSGYETLSAELEARGYRIGKSALHAYGQSFEDRLAALRESSEQAKAVVTAALTMRAPSTRRLCAWSRITCSSC